MTQSMLTTSHAPCLGPKSAVPWIPVDKRPPTSKIDADGGAGRIHAVDHTAIIADDVEEAIPHGVVVLHLLGRAGDGRHFSMARTGVRHLLYDRPDRGIVQFAELAHAERQVRRADE